ncbi:MAG: arabinogalactan endo-1,4-beta-galactosidase [Gemmatimonas sp.]|nr:arabinogalactan endo-1,4-beta-galactosidase [Gemmatimonas sp.]
MRLSLHAAIVGVAAAALTLPANAQSAPNAPQPSPNAAASAAALDLPYVIGADLSFLAQAEAHGTRFRDGGVEKPGLQIFRDHGYNWIRLRLFHTVANSPWPLPNDLAYTLALAKRAKAMGYKFLLDYHYSDTWADGDKQFMPKAWEQLSTPVLITAVETYTRETITALREGGALPDMVQIGNEIAPGMMFPAGRLPDQWDTLAELLKAGIRGVDAGRGTEARPLIMLHIDKGGDVAKTKWWLDNAIRRGVPFDVIGQSYYPWWHGTLLDLRDNLAFMAEAYRKPIIMVEVAYNFRPGEYIGKPAPFAESPEGQREFLETIHQLVLATPHGLGKGVMWWEPAVEHSPIRGRGMFDDAGNALPVIEVFDKWTRGKQLRP